MTIAAANSPEASAKTNPQFIESIQAGLRYWQQKTETLGPEQVRWLDQRRKNLHQAVLFGLNQPETWEDTAQLLLQTFDFSEWRGYWSEWIPVLEQALANAPERETVLCGRLQNRLGQLYRLDNRLAEAEEQHKAALKLAQQLENDELRLISYTCLAEFYFRQGNVDQTRVYGQLALDIVQAVPDLERMRGFTHKILGHIEEYVGNWSEAINHLQKAVQIWRTLENDNYLARCLNDLGNVFSKKEEFTLAQQAYEEAGAVLEPTNNVLDKARVSQNLGVLYYRQEKWAEAEAAFLKIDPIALKEQKELNLLALFHNNLGNVYVKSAQFSRAIENLELAADMFRSIDDRLNLGNSLGTLATAYMEFGKHDAAKRCFREAIALLGEFPKSDFARRVKEKYTLAHQALMGNENGEEQHKKPASES